MTATAFVKRQHLQPHKKIKNMHYHVPWERNTLVAARASMPDIDDK